jgi:urea carboxylase-associated protein 2
MDGTVVDTMPVVPPDAATLDFAAAAALKPADVVWDEVVAGGNYTTLAVAAGTHVRLEDVAGDACAGVLLHRIGHPTERLNVADTVKVRWQAYLAEGQLLLSDMGRVLAAIVTDTSGRHDTICGTTNQAANDARYGDGSIAGSAPNGRDLFALGLTKNGRSGREVAPNVNFFKGTRVDPDGTINLLPSSGAGAEVVLRCELDLLVSVVNVAHPLDDRDQYTVTPLRVTAWRGQVAPADDAIRNATPEGRRAYQNSELARGLLG